MPHFRITKWDSIKKFGQLEVLKASGVALILVPILAQIYLLTRKTIEAALCQQEFQTFHSLLERTHELLISFRLPQSLKYGYVSALSLLVAKICYNMFCPTLVKDYDYSDEGRYVQEVLGAKSELEAKRELIKYIDRVYQKNPRSVLDRFNIQSQGKPPTKGEFFEQIENQGLKQLFSPARFCVQYSAFFRRWLCILLYLLGFGLLFWIFILQTYRVFAFLLAS